MLREHVNHPPFLFISHAIRPKRYTKGRKHSCIVKKQTIVEKAQV